jgi:DNA-binding transcriptional ArsR family regulator
MCPVEVIEATDLVTSMVSFRTSVVYEMIVSLHTIQAARRHHEWVKTAKLTLGAGFVTELKAIYGEAKNGACLFEFPVDYVEHSDIPGFIRYVREMDRATFLFYLVGRVISRQEIIEIGVNTNKIIEAVNNEPHPCLPAEYLAWVLTDVHAYQNRLADLWETYWNTFFCQQVEMLPDYWTDAIAEKERILARSGGHGLLDSITGRTELPRSLPETTPITELVFIPLYYVSAQSYVFFGYGNVTFLFDSLLSEERVTVINASKEQALEIAKALGDSTRLNILRLIAQDGHHMHGKRIAEKLDISPSAVSRQLGQLRDSGLIAEEPQSNQTVAYHLITEAITSLPDKILDYLFS